jgi:hypothetical protein
MKKIVQLYVLSNEEPRFTIFGRREAMSMEDTDQLLQLRLLARGGRRIAEMWTGDSASKNSMEKGKVSNPGTIVNKTE